MKPDSTIISQINPQYFWDVDLLTLDDNSSCRLIYFDDVDLADWPVLIENPKLRWVDVKKRIAKEVMEYCRFLTG